MLIGQYSSARDMALIGQALIRDVPNEYSIYREKEFTFNGIRQLGHVFGLLWDNSLNVDSIKTSRFTTKRVTTSMLPPPKARCA